jgi:hypothetical protein
MNNMQLRNWGSRTISRRNERARQKSGQDVKLAGDIPTYLKSISTPISPRTRRVKCDEGRPACQRCINWAGPEKCDGYDFCDPPKAPTKIKGSPRILLPDFKPLCRTPTIRKFDNDEERNFFQKFCIESAVQLTGSRKSELWNRVVLQASEMEPYVRYAVVAIGALDFHKLSHGGTDLENIRRELTFREYGVLTAAGLINSSPGSKRMIFEERRARKVAYEVYGKAIATLREAILEQRSDIMTKLVACLLFVLFEVYHGNNESAAMQTYAGIRMMEEYTQQRSEWTSSLGTIRPTPIDQEIVEEFALLKIQVMGWTDRKKPEVRLSNYANQPVEEISHEFRSLKHAAFILSTIMLQTAHFKFAQGTPPYLAPEEAISSLAPNKQSAHHKVLNQFHQWKAAFAPFLRRAETEQGKHLRKEAYALQMQYLFSYLWATSGAPLPKMYYQRHTKELMEVVLLARKLRDEEEYSKRSFDPRLLLPLMMVGFVLFSPYEYYLN